VLEPLDELGPLEQVGEPVGAEEDVDDVGVAVLVGRDQPLRQHHLGPGQPPAQARQPRPLGAQLRPGGRELLAGGVEVGLHGVQPPLQQGDVALDLADELREGRRAGGQALLGAPGAVDLVLQLGRAGRGTDGSGQE
jgi:hypothetical protein